MKLSKEVKFAKFKLLAERLARQKRQRKSFSLILKEIVDSKGE